MTSTVSNKLLHPSRQAAGKRFKSGSWRDEAKARATRLRTDARWLPLHGQAQHREAMEVEIFDPLDEVDRLTFTDRVTFREWLSGSQVEECWRLLRQAEEGLLHLATDRALAPMAKRAEAHGAKVLGADDPFVVTLRGLLVAPEPDAAVVRTAALDVLRASHESSDRQHRQMRSFRNQLLGLSMVLALLAMGLLVVQSLMSTSLVPIPKNVPALNGTTTLALVMFFGSVGALFSAVPSLATLPVTSSPFNMARQQAVLKVATGAWSAVIGLLVVDAGLAASAPDISGLAGLTVVAALFGAGQEAVTRFADHKASSILGGP